MSKICKVGNNFHASYCCWHKNTSYSLLRISSPFQICWHSQIEFHKLHFDCISLRRPERARNFFCFARRIVFAFLLWRSLALALSPLLKVFSLNIDLKIFSAVWPEIERECARLQSCERARVLTKIECVEMHAVGTCRVCERQRRRRLNFFAWRSFVHEHLRARARRCDDA